MSDDESDDRRDGKEYLGGVQAADTAVQVLSALIDMGGALPLKTVAERAGMQPPKAHRYLMSFCRSGLAERDAVSGGYRLGPLAVRIGLAALRHLNVVKMASPALEGLRDEFGFTVGLAIWGTMGPTFVRLEETNDPLIISGRIGTVLPVTISSTGRVFGAFMPRTLVEPFVSEELRGVLHVSVPPRNMPSKLTSADVEALFVEVRQHKLANVKGELNAGIHGISAPIFDYRGAIAGVITVMGAAGLIDVRFDGAIARRLTAMAEETSRRMGWGNEILRSGSGLY